VLGRYKTGKYLEVTNARLAEGLVADGRQQPLKSLSFSSMCTVVPLHTTIVSRGKCPASRVIVAGTDDRYETTASRQAVQIRAYQSRSPQCRVS
jgi:hypothetical protein